MGESRLWEGIQGKGLRYNRSFHTIDIFRYANISISYSLLCNDTLGNKSCIPIRAMFSCIPIRVMFSCIPICDLFSCITIRVTILSLSLFLSFSLLLSLYLLSASLSLFSLLLSLSLLSVIFFGVSNGRFRPCFFY